MTFALDYDERAGGYYGQRLAAGQSDPALGAFGIGFEGRQVTVWVREAHGRGALELSPMEAMRMGGALMLTAARVAGLPTSAVDNIGEALDLLNRAIDRLGGGA